MRISLLLLAVVLSACSDDEAKAPLTPGGGSSHMVDQDRPDSGRNVDDMDAGSTSDAGEGPLPGECMRVEPVVFNTDEVPTVTAIASPTDFKVSRQVARWSGACPNPTLIVELSNGICPNGQGHELEFSFPASSIADGAIGFGPNEIGPDTIGSIRIRYTRPARFRPEGEYGNCDGSAGTLTFYDPPDVSRPMNLRATFDLNLTPCDDDKSNPEQHVWGYFDVRVRRDLGGVCPP
jgi:hypothetical protein